MNKRNIFLFGAGATLEWGSPLTSELTTLIRSNGFKTIDNNTTITEFIYQTLLSNGFKESDINFETIINVIEELIVYYSYFNGEKKLPSLLQPFYTPLFEENLFNFSIKGGEIKHGYKLQIPKGVDNDFIRNSYHNETPPQFFFQHLLSVLLTQINVRISSYAYHTPGNSVIINHGKEYMISLFTKWMQIHAENGILRMYTLNYERIFKILLERANISVFEGFDSKEFIDYSANLRANVPKILSDTESHIHYNLHGSAFWRVHSLDSYQLPNPEIALTTAPVFSINDEQAALQIEKGKTLMITNIITGYQKAQKAMITPFKQMQSSFDRDCCFADIIYIIGYSFGDEHINASLRSAMRYNQKLKMIVVDPFFIKNQMDSELIIKLFPYRDMENIHPNKIGENLYSYFDGAFIVHTVGFKEFLEL